MRVHKLVRAAMKGDKDALIALIMDQKQSYYGLAYSYLKNDHDAMDACEEMIIIVYEQIQYLRKADSFYSWSKTILANVCKKMLLKRSRETVTASEHLEQVNDRSDQAQEHLISVIEMKVDLEKAVKQLPKDTQEMIKLKYWFDMELQHVAEVMELPLGTIKSRLHYAKKQLLKMLERRE